MIKEKEYMVLNIIFRTKKKDTEYLFATLRTNRKSKRKDTLVALLEKVRRQSSVEAFIFAFDSVLDTPRCIEHISFSSGSITVIHLCRLEVCENQYLKSLLTCVLQSRFRPVKTENPALNLLYDKFAELCAGEYNYFKGKKVHRLSKLKKKRSREELSLIVIIGGKIKFF